MKKLFIILLATIAAFATATSQTVIDMRDYGVRPDRKENSSPRVRKAIERLQRLHPEGNLTLRFAPGRYDFHESGSSVRELYISNHDQDNPKSVGIMLERWDNIEIDGSGADFMFHGVMLPVAARECRGFKLRNLHIDFPTPHIAQIRILGDTPDGIEFEAAPDVRFEIDKKGSLSTVGEGWKRVPRAGIAFEPDTRRLVYRTSDLGCPLDSVVSLGNRRYRAPRWHHERLTAGTVVALRSYGRPTPGILIDECVATTIDNVKVHYAEGMGLLAQMSEDITLSGFGVCLRGADDPRYFTTQADATHFSGCRGLISSTGGLYEGMMDDAINVHGTYLKVVGREGARTLRARYMHHQTYGFKWGEAGDSVRILRARTMEPVDTIFRIVAISPADKPTTAGAKDFVIELDSDLPADVSAEGDFGLENLSWTPEVIFADNIVRNNRARGSLFSTPRRTVVERNLFDHTSGCAVLLCGDCMGWFETGACRDVTIRGNRFVNALTNLFQFTEAVISIYPEIHDLDAQRRCFHGGKDAPGILIEDNEFVTFDAPLLYVKSTEGLTFRNNTVHRSTDYEPFHSNRHAFRILHSKRINIEDNRYDDSFDPSVIVE